MLKKLTFISTWIFPLVYLAAGILVAIFGLDFLSTLQNKLFASLLILYSVFRFYRAYKKGLSDEIHE